MAAHTPELSEFIDLKQRRLEGRRGTGFPELINKVTVAAYNNSTGFMTLMVRISEDMAEKLGVEIGQRYECMVHPEGTHIALRQVEHGGSAIFLPKGSRSLVFQTTFRAETMDPQKAKPSVATRKGDALIFTLEPDVTSN